MTPNPDQPAPAPAALLEPPPEGGSAPILLRAAMVADAHGAHAPGAVLISPTDGRWRIDAAGDPRSIGVPEHARLIDLPDRVLIPALVNAHTHLDLTHIGPVPFDPREGFVSWLDMIIANRLTDPEQIAASVRAGVERSVRAGTIAVGDIAGAAAAQLTIAPLLELANAPIHGVSYLEFFGIGSSATLAIERIDRFLRCELDEIQTRMRGSHTRVGISPHATNTVDLDVYRYVSRAASAKQIPLTTHLAETLEERELIAQGTGTQRALLDRFGVWDDSVLERLGHGQHPIEHLAPALELASYLCAHVNDAPDHLLQILRRTETSVAYCARGHEYFGHPDRLGPHPYRAMLDAQINVCLGTDSIVNLDTPDRIGVIDDMRLLSRRDACPPERLIAMATINGASALGLNPSGFELKEGNTPLGLLALPIEPQATGPWTSAMSRDDDPEWVIFQP